MATGDGPSLDLALKISDLSSASQLKSLLQGQAMPMFKFAAATAPYWSGPVEKMPQGAKLSFSLSHDGCWKTSTGISFGLTGSAACSLEILTSGCAIDYLENLDATPKAGLPAGDYSGSVYVKLSLSFNITGNVSGSGSVGALGICGNAKGSVGENFVFAHRIKCGTLLKDAITEACNSFVFPFQPSCAVQMAPGDIAQVTVNGCMSYSLSLNYGIDTFKFGAPGVQTVLESCAKGAASLTLPSGTVDIGATASLGLTHSDDFTAIVEKLDANDAFLYLMRARKTDVSGGAGIGAQVKVTGMPALSVDQQKLQAGVDRFTRGLGGQKAAALCGDLQGKLNDKLSDWMSKAVQGGAGLKANWDAEKDTTLISKYKVALGNPDVLSHSWDYFCQGNLQSAVGAGGLMLEPGSGVCSNLNRSLTVCVTFFNFFHAQDVSSYFQKTKAYVTDAGNIRFLFDVGEESDSTVNKALQKARIHFVAVAESKTPADVQLEIELSETNNHDEARHMAAIPAYLSQSAESAAIANDMQQFVAAHPKGTLNLNCTLESSAYGKLTCSPYNGKQPPADQSVDAKNWQVFHDAAVALLNLAYAPDSYTTWQKWNLASNGASGAKLADRRHCGDASAGEAFWEGRPPDVQLKLNYFCLASSDFMNLCDDLHQLAQLLSTVKIPDDWNRLLDDLKGIVLRDVNTDFAKPAVASMLKLCLPKQVTYEKQECGEALTCTMSLM